MTTLNQQKTKSAVFSRTLTEFEKYLNEISSKTMTSSIVVNLSNRVERLKDIYIEFEKIQTNIEFVSENFEDELNYRENLTTRYDETIALALPRIESFNKEAETNHIAI